MWRKQQHTIKFSTERTPKDLLIVTPYSSQAKMNPALPSFGDEFQSEVTDLFESGLTDKEVIKFLEEIHSISVSPRTLARRKEDWGLVHHASQQIDQLDEHIKTYFDKGLTYSQIHHALSTTHGYTHSKRTLERKLKAMDLSRRLDDIDMEKVDVDTVVTCMMEIHQTPEGRNAGYRKMRQMLQTNFGINVHHMTVALINQTLDPDGVENRAKRVLKRRVFNTPGPNFIWSADGHDKLKKFGITLYGFIDAWSRKILGIFVHVTNNDPRHVGYYYLQLVKREGGIPRRTTTDRGTETIQMAGHQINLTEHYNPHCLDSSTSHLFTKSTHNQKIECLWSQLMKQFNSELINQLFSAAEEHLYDPEDPLEQLVFLYLWVPLLQEALNEWTTNYNSYKRRLDKKSSLPTQCSADWCYAYPDRKGGIQGLIPVPPSAVKTLEEAFYPEGPQLMQTSPTWFYETIEQLQSGLGLVIPNVNVHNVWEVFSLILTAVNTYDEAWLIDPSNDESQTIRARSHLPE
ncbi:uncharacterized protein PGTG_10033 [Puccinia graminis f. sp. tritici CRL 75-36-700-3]|uniref:Integrase catalytic domain-containing protein n=1 Tax=Puccinia graminis f. sp. tritici (strain CRL 75-36-700-3 / race SCCL) TaxID=418459 RepID=E3KJ38_PUCGT|nr:uncharacterized protein PGTG_10033 [Puccinia graminis f. sp. tritici CRL 75-36-700-3]EFP84313.2 hypothetical protein PGTG_10033 [Puccinia graminis f. sp. tritici CRL 75-36-700-3]